MGASASCGTDPASGSEPARLRDRRVTPSLTNEMRDRLERVELSARGRPARNVQEALIFTWAYVDCGLDKWAHRIQGRLNVFLQEAHVRR